MKHLFNVDDKSSPQHTLKYITQDHYERYHLKYVKSILKFKALIIGCWGDSGLHPLFYEGGTISIVAFKASKTSYYHYAWSLLVN